MEKIKSLASKYWFITIPLAVFGAYGIYQMYIAPMIASKGVTTQTVNTPAA